MLFCLKFLQINGRILRRNLHFIETKCHAGRMCFPSMAFFMVLILILQQKNDSLDLPFYFTLSFFCCFRNTNSLLRKHSTAGCFCLIKSKRSRIFGAFPKRKHCTIVSFVQCGYGWSSWIRTSGMTESKSVALPLGYTPITLLLLYQKSNSLSIEK